MPKPRLPRGANHDTVQLVPSTVANVVTNNAGISASTIINLTVNASIIEVNAIAQGIYLKYTTQAAPVAVTSSNFDEYIQSGGIRHYVVPAGITAVTVIEAAPSATIILIEK